MTTSTNAKLAPTLLLCLSAGCALSGEENEEELEEQRTVSSWRENGCEESDLDDRRGEEAVRRIHFGHNGLSYVPRCVLISMNESVRFEGNFAAHPLAPGNPRDESSGTGRSPIPRTSSGTDVEVQFPEVGIYPYYCTIHSYEEGEGMAGVVVVR